MSYFCLSAHTRGALPATHAPLGPVLQVVAPPPPSYCFKQNNRLFSPRVWSCIASGTKLQGVRSASSGSPRPTGELLARASGLLLEPWCLQRFYSHSLLLRTYYDVGTDRVTHGETRSVKYLYRFGAFWIYFYYCCCFISDTCDVLSGLHRCPFRPHCCGWSSLEVMSCIPGAERRTPLKKAAF